MLVLSLFPGLGLLDRAAEKRLKDMLALGFTPFAMLWRPSNPKEEKFAPGQEWRDFRRQWCRPAIIHATNS